MSRQAKSERTADDDRVLHIAYPVPLSLMGSITTLIGTAWPEARMRSNGDRMDFIIPAAEPRKIGPRKARAIVQEGDRFAAENPEVDGQVTALDDGSADISVAVEPDESWAVIARHVSGLLEHWASQEGSDEPAVNYLSRTLRHPDTAQRFVLIVAHGDRTPEVLREQAERRAERAEATVERYRERYGDLD